ncbi:YgdI/YgdR family lipoprotein [Alcanivorax sp. 1008]|uniref:YgdI/YgdR family lipoprotein n=1 Tax=Alcanivorax sp. 1008 TaxID=2816853 RepID=UPI001D7B412B|nr:YgdI/YgdR family lipoprotein [Alcanivorax sp. 1008]MCC1498304.1 hypothetical protein [Alcanivorax sp. 1008]
MKAVLLIGLLALISSCTTTNRPESGGFYSYVDAQGNMVTVMRDTPAAANSSGSAPLRPALDELDARSLDQQGQYQTDEQVQKKIEDAERDRFVIYRDASGYQITEQVDVVAARKAKEDQPLPYEELGRAGNAYIERVEGVPERCCDGPLKQAVSLKPGLEALVSFSPPWYWVSMPDRHPAVAFRIEPGIAALRLQTFLTGVGYLHPQAVFLDQDGAPILLVDNLFARRYPETWSRLGYLEGELPVEKGSVWLVLYLGYAGVSDRGRPELVPGEYLWAEPSAPLALKGELVVRALRTPPAP